MSERRTLEIPAQSGGWLEAKQGSLIRIIDIEGHQIADTFAVSLADKTEWLSPAHTRAVAARLFPKVGQVFSTNRYRPMLTFVEDHSPGVHDLLWRACDPLLYAAVGITDYHPSCNENFRKASAEIGWTPAEVPDPVNFFQNTPVSASGDLSSGTSPSVAGDYVTLRAEMDLVIIVAPCSWDVPGHPINGERCTGIRLEVTAPAA